MADTWDVSDLIFPRAPRRLEPSSSVANAKSNIVGNWTRPGSDISIPLLGNVPNPVTGKVGAMTASHGPSGTSSPNVGEWPRAPRRASTVFPAEVTTAVEETVFNAFGDLKQGRINTGLIVLAAVGIGGFLILR